jgi:hypothetical protein
MNPTITITIQTPVLNQNPSAPPSVAARVLVFVVGIFDLSFAVSPVRGVGSVNTAPVPCAAVSADTELEGRSTGAGCSMLAGTGVGLDTDPPILSLCPAGVPFSTGLLSAVFFLAVFFFDIFFLTTFFLMPFFFAAFFMATPASPSFLLETVLRPSFSAITKLLHLNACHPQKVT